MKKEAKAKKAVQAAQPPRRPTYLSSFDGGDLGLAALLLVLLFFVYFPALSGGILWDDDAHITRPSLQSLSGLVRIWFQVGSTQQYYPLLHTAFWIEHGFWGNLLAGYHVVNVLQHALAAFLLVAVLRRLAIPGAWLAAFLFALHPVQVESVAWISEQKNTLSTVFYLASALLYLRFDRTRERRTYWIALALFVMALASKTVTATLPAALLVVFWWQRGRLDFEKDVKPLLPWLAMGALAGLITARIEHNFIGASGSFYALTLGERFLLAGRVICFYAAKLVWPAGLSFIYPHWTIDAHDASQYAFPAAVAIAAAVLIAVARKYRGPLAGFLFFAGTLVPVLGFLNVYPFRFAYVADHFQYVACLGLFVPVAAGLDLAQKKLSGISKTAAAGAGPAIVAVLAFVAWNQSGVYRSAEALYRDVLAHNPDSWLARSNLGSVLMQEGQGPAAMVQLETALQLNPDLPEAHNNVGLLLSDIPDEREHAIQEFHEALKLRPNYAEAHNNLGSLLAEKPDQIDQAMAQYKEALRIDPTYASAHNNLGSALSAQGSDKQAMDEFQSALEYDPNLAEAQANIGMALMKANRVPEAVYHFQAALRIRPDMDKVRQILAQIRQQAPGLVH